MSFKSSVVLVLVFSGLLRVVIGLMLIDAHYELATLAYKYVFVFSGLGLIVFGLRKFLTIFHIFRYTR